MQTIYLVASDYEKPLDAHLAIKRMLKLPEYYGSNADALADCLTPKHPVALWLAGMGDDEVSVALRKCAAAVEDQGGSVRYL